MQIIIVIFLILVQLFIIISTFVNLIQGTIKLPLFVLHVILYALFPLLIILIDSPDRTSNNQRKFFHAKFFYLLTSFLSFFEITLFYFSISNNPENINLEFQMISALPIFLFFNTIFSFLNLLTLYQLMLSFAV